MNMDTDAMPEMAPGVIVEAGAYEGAWTVKAARDGHTVHAFEPATRACRLAWARTATYSNAHVYNVALGGAFGVATLHDCNRDGATWYPAEGDSETVQVVDVALVMDLLGHVDLMHLNAEGAEVDILERLIHTVHILRVGAIMLQWHPRVETNDRIAALDLALQETHVKLPLYHCWGYWERKHNAGG